MKNHKKLLSIILAFFICTTLLSGCDLNIFGDSQTQTPTTPGIEDPTGPENPADTENSTQPENPTNPDDPTGSDQGQTPSNPADDDSSFMDGDDHAQMPFG